MFLSEARHSNISNLSLVFFAAGLLLALSLPCHAQGATDHTGTGGRHTIQGRIFFPSGRRADSPGVLVKLESVNNAPLSIFTDSSGAFAFKNLVAGSYTIVIESTDDFEPIRENVYIDDPGSSSIRGRTVTATTPRVMTVPIYLSTKQRTSVKPGVLSAALASAPKAAADLYLAALQSSRAGDHKKAVEQLKSAIALHPEFPLALNELGVQYLFLGQADNSANVLAEAVKLAPDDIPPRLNYSIALLNQNKFSESEAQLRQVLEKNDTLTTAHLYLGIALSKQQKLDEAEKELLIAISSKTAEIAIAHRYLGGVYWGKRQYARAADQLEIYLKLMPNAGDSTRTREAIKELRSKEKKSSGS